MQQPISEAAAAAEAALRLEQQRAAIKSRHNSTAHADRELPLLASPLTSPLRLSVVRPAGHAATSAPAVGTASASSADPSAGSKRTAAVMSAKTASAAASTAAAAAASTTGPNKENDTAMEPKVASKPVSPPTLISVPPALLPAPTAQSAVVVVESAPSSQLCSEELGGSEDPAERIAAESKRQRKSRGELSQDPKDWTEQIARNQATLKELNGALEQQRQLNTDLERSLRRAQRLVSWTIAQAERQVNNETQAQLLEGGGIEASAAAAASATSAPASPAAASSSTAAAAAAPASTATDFVLYDREEEIFAAAIAAQDDPMALRTVPAQSYLDPSLHTNQTWSWMSLQYRMDIDARHILLREAKTFNQTLTQEIADACRWAERVAESAERSVEQMTLAEPMRAEIKLRIQQKAEAMIAAVMDKARTEDESTAATAEAAAAAAAESSSSSSSAAAAAPAESSAASYEAASKQQ